ncbi:MAG: prephenate dehydrogenase/arogenate dehydrogenase family protein [Thiomicrospira sp.]|uniref:prephenate dehydrogenase n=1 Tax=Thiomicrospira sp. TaxID=935 RepID=UPI0019EA5B06|nr:prephenate dehydrogenase/arogenate dehydrogenase family protein [Thiomicrospira sp.]MBE0493371.1 prephenate dehydrogenase/arogenate dehydrogenase family protein [Thiomicrospira sp.]
MRIGRLCVIGVGLIGGSFALKLKQLGLVDEVVGYGHRVENLEKAVALGVIDRYETDVTLAVKGADLVMLAVPLGVIGSLFAEIEPHLDAKTIVTDAGSAKDSVIKDIIEKVGGCPPNFVPGHPIAGREKSGVEAVDADLYQNHRVILTPTETTNESAVELVQTLWSEVGANVSLMAASFHDEVFAATSHLPHMLAFALVDMLNEHAELGNVFQYTAGGFRDFTRIASSDATMWRDIALHNSVALVKWLNAYQAELQTLTQLIESQDGPALFALFDQAKTARDQHILHRNADL